MDILDKISQTGGVGGAFAVLFALVCWKLYRDLNRCKDGRLADAKAVTEKVEELKREQEEKYRESMRATNETLRQLDKFMDKIFDWMTRKR
jgi:uncharacterized membrane protein YgaE (UPF0421/DUF939 family)